MSSVALAPEILHGGEVLARRFEPRSAAPFIDKSVSEETRRAYGRAVKEFFQSAGVNHPPEVVPADIPLWRDKAALTEEERGDRRLQVLGGALLLRVPKGVGSDHTQPRLAEARLAAGFAVGACRQAPTAKEVRYLLSGPDREKPE